MLWLYFYQNVNLQSEDAAIYNNFRNKRKKSIFNHMTYYYDINILQFQCFSLIQSADRECPTKPYVMSVIKLVSILSSLSLMTEY
ncbi:hypothetical protein pb186bvf_020638 [Paramecium bursaria]